MTLASHSSSPRKSKSARRMERQVVASKQVAAHAARSAYAQAAAPAPAARPVPAVRAFISSARPTEALLFECRDRRGFTVVTALVDRRSGTLSFIAQATGLDSAECDHLRLVARGPASAPPLAEVDLEGARLRLARAILATRIAGGALPTWLAERGDLVGDPANPASRIDDVYLCIACDMPLPVHEQVARADALGRLDAPPRCPHCRGDSLASDSEGEAWLGRAWLMNAAGLPRRALVCAARAEGLRLAPARLDAVRGAAHLALGDRAAALPYLRSALSSDPHGARAGILRGWLAT